MSWLETATCSKQCYFICKRVSNNGLGRVNKISRAFAFFQKNIDINLQSVCCFYHFDDFGLLSEENLNNIPTISKYYSREELDFLRDSLIKSKAPSTSFHQTFDKFRNIKYLSNNTCLQITGWTKQQFIEFCNHIKSVKKTKGRTKTQLVAIYRYIYRYCCAQSTN